MRVRAASLINAWVATVPERSRRSVQRLVTAKHWPAKQVMCVEILVSQVKKQHLTAPNKRPRLEWCTSMLERLGEAKRPHSGCFSCKTQISLSFRATLLLVRSHSADELHAVLCRTVSRISIAHSFTVDPLMSLSACYSQGFGCRTPLQRSMRLTMTRHRYD